MRYHTLNLLNAFKSYEKILKKFSLEKASFLRKKRFLLWFKNIEKSCFGVLYAWLLIPTFFSKITPFRKKISSNFLHNFWMREANLKNGDSSKFKLAFPLSNAEKIWIYNIFMFLTISVQTSRKMHEGLRILIFARTNFRAISRRGPIMRKT